ncbi:hypothetical protein PCE1_000818 [Barthelona sp. PCE]
MTFEMDDLDSFIDMIDHPSDGLGNQNDGNHMMFNSESFLDVGTPMELDNFTIEHGVSEPFSPPCMYERGFGGNSKQHPTPSSSYNSSGTSFMGHPSIYDSFMNDLSELMEDIGETETDHNVSDLEEVNEVSGLTSYCFKTTLGGATVLLGENTIIDTDTCCDELRCSKCCFPVLIFDNLLFSSECSVTFFRNNYPNKGVIRAIMDSKRGARGYCCQCAFRTVETESGITVSPTSWHCSGHKHLVDKT